MAKPIKIGPLTAALLGAAANLIEALPSSGEPAGPGELLAAIADLATGLGDAGAIDSDGGRVLTAKESASVLGVLAVDLDYAAAHIPADAVSIPIAPWVPLACRAVALLLPGDGLVSVVRTALYALADAARDGIIDASELRMIIAAVRVAAESS